MTNQDKKVLLPATFVALTSIIFTVFLTLDKINVEIISHLFFPSFQKLVISSLVSLVTSIVIVIIFFNGDEKLSNHTIKYYMIQPTLEEMIFRLNLLIFIDTYNYSNDIAIISAIGIIQAFTFAIIHFSKKYFLKNFLLGLIWYIATIYGGIIPAIVGHTAANQFNHYRIKKAYGFFDNEE